MIRRPPRSTLSSSSAASDVYKRQILFRETMAPNLRVQGIIKGSNGSGSLIADSHPSGQTRGLIQLKGGAKEITLGGGAVLQLMRTLPGGRINQGIVEVPKDGGISHAFMAYMQTSEQVVSMLAVGTLFDGDRVVSAGGYMVQLLPEAARGPIMIMTERLRDFESIDPQLRDPNFDPSWLLN